MSTNTQRKIKIAKRGQSGPNLIRYMFSLAAKLNQKRSTKGLENLISLGIGAPHIPSNPVVDLALEYWNLIKQERRKKIEYLDEMIASEQDIIVKNSFIKARKDQLAKLVEMDGYQSSQGVYSCRKLVAELFNRYYLNLNATEKNICICNGATQALYVLFQAFVEPGVNVGCFAPFFPAYKKQVEGLGGTFTSIPTAENCRPTAKLLDEYLTKYPDISVLIINDPCNPTGVKLTRQEQKEIIEVLSRPENKEILLICDETYHELVFGDCPEFFLNIADMEEFRGRTCIVWSLSKTIGGCPGIRIGFAYAPDINIDGKLESLGDILGTLMLDTTTSVSTIMQYITEFLISAKLGIEKKRGCDEIQRIWESSIKDIYSTAITIGSAEFEKCGFPLVVKPEGAFFGMVSASHLIGKRVPPSVKLLCGREVKNLPKKVGSEIIKTDINVAMYLLFAAEVVAIPASGFVYDDKKGHLRVSFAVEQDKLIKAAAQFKNAADQLIQA